MAQTHSTAPRIQPSLDAHSIIDRIKDVVTFNRSTVTSIAADRSATIEAGIIVALTGLASAIGHRADVVNAITAGVLGWAGLAVAIWFIADRFTSTPLPPNAIQPLLRTIGYALAPTSLVIIHFLWGLGPMIAGVGALWSFAVTVFAVRHTAHMSWLRALVLTVAGAIIVNVIGFTLSIMTGIDPTIW